MWRKIGIILLVVILLLAGLYFVLANRSQPVPTHPFFAQFESGQPLNIAHQGGEQIWPSNTLFAFQNSVDLGVDMLEMDFHQTADGVLVLMHDDTVDRTTDGRGAIADMTFADIQALDAGYYWTEDEQTYPYRGQGIVVPALTEIFEAFPDMAMNIEIKPTDPDISRDFCQTLRDYNMLDKVLVGSFHDEALQAFREACPEVATSMTQSEIQPFWILNVLGLSSIYQSPAEAFQVPETFNLPVLGEVTVITDRFVENAHKHNIDVHAWTINETEAMERLLATGLDGVITDRPDRLQTVIGEQ